MLRLCIPKLPEPSKPLKTSHYFFVSLHVAATRRFVSAADDETRKGEAITDAMATQSVKPKADGSDSIAP